MAIDPTTGMEQLPETSKLAGAFPSAPKGYIGPKEIAPALQEVSRKQADVEAELAKSDIRIEKAKREEQAQKAEKMQEFYKSEKKAIEELPERAAYKKSVEDLAAAKFEPTKDNMQSIANLFSLMGVIGAVIGKGNAMQGMYAMNGVLEGHIKGRRDLVKQQALEFEKNFKVLQTKVDAAYKELQEAVNLRIYDQKAGQEAITMAIARSESPLLKEMEARQGPLRTLNFLKDVKENTLGKMVSLNNDLRAKAEDRELRRSLYEMRYGEEKLAPAERKEKRGIENLSTEMERLRATFKPEYANFVVDAAGDLTASAKARLAGDPEMSNWWRAYENVAMPERHAMFGAALTGGEQASWRKASIGPGNSDKEIESWFNERERILENKLDSFQKLNKQRKVSGSPDLSSDPAGIL